MKPRNYIQSFEYPVVKMGDVDLFIDTIYKLHPNDIVVDCQWIPQLNTKDHLYDGEYKSKGMRVFYYRETMVLCFPKNEYKKADVREKILFLASEGFIDDGYVFIDGDKYILDNNKITLKRTKQ